jgi:hypothetical protein
VVAAARLSTESARAPLCISRRPANIRGTHMFANLFQLITGRPASPDIHRYAFVQEVRVHQTEARNGKVERVILVCWMLIALKHVLIIWACHHYPVPFHQLWVNVPTWLLGVLATGLYYGRVRAMWFH